MSEPKLVPVKGRCAWTAGDMITDGSWLQEVSDEERAAIVDSTKPNMPVIDTFGLRRQDFAFGVFADRIQRILNELENGRGVVVIRGLPVDALGEEGCRVAFWGLGVHLGVPLSQSAKGDLMGEVRDLGVRLGEPTSRGYRGNQLLRLHTDRADYLLLACVRSAKAGGTSRLVSSAAVHNEMIEKRPDLAAALYQPFYMSRQGDIAPGQNPFYVAPVFGVRSGKFSCQLSRSYIESAQKFLDVPKLSPKQQEGLEMLSSIAERSAWSLDLRAGDVLLVNNHVNFHARTEFEDYEEPNRKRLLLRLWISSPIGRALPENAKTMWGNVEPGLVRGGVPAKDEWWCDVLSRDALLARSTSHARSTVS